MENYIVLYRDASLTFLDEPYFFACLADDTDHAEEQFINANEPCEIVWVHMGNDNERASIDYYGIEDGAA